MAANNYYQPNAAYNHPPSYDQVSRRSPDPFSRPLPGLPDPRISPSPSYTGRGPYSHADNDIHPSHHSQQTLGSDTSAYGAVGRTTDEQYTDNIPLKSQNQYANAPPPGWMQQPTQYPPAEMMESPVDGGSRRKKKKRFYQKKMPWVTYALTVIQIIVFIVELVKSAQLTGSPVITPRLNPMIGPSTWLQVSMGARYTPCMKNVEGIQDRGLTVWSCPNTTTTAVNCTLSDLCGFGGVPNPIPTGGSLQDRPEPNQWFRFIIPIFLHAGFIHIGFNMLAQMTMGADLEKMIGWWRYSLVYFSSGIFGFVFGGNFSAPGLTVTGCSGCLFGIMAVFLLDLLYTWKERPSAWVELILMIVGVGISFVLGLLPGLDNFAHIGGFIMGLVLGLVILRSPNALRERIGLARNPYVAMSGGSGAAGDDENKASRTGPSVVDFFKGRRNLTSSSSEGSGSGPLSFFKGRKPLWWAWWLVRLGALVAVIIGFILLLINFYNTYKSNCTWCYRLSCLPIKDWCKQGNFS